MSHNQLSYNPFSSSSPLLLTWLSIGIHICLSPSPLNSPSTRTSSSPPLPVLLSVWTSISLLLCLETFLASLKVDQSATLGIFNFSSLPITNSAQWRPGSFHSSKATLTLRSEVQIEDFETNILTYVAPLTFATGHESESTGLKDLEISLSKI